MTGTQIKTLAESYIDDTLDLTDALAWLNDCLVIDLGVDARILSSESIVIADDETWYDLPSDFLAVHEIVNSDDDPYVYSYEIRRDGKIRFADADTVTLWYWASPTELTALSETPDAHTLLHKPIAKFLAAKHRAKEADGDTEELGDYNRLMMEYENDKTRALYQIDRRRLDSTGNTVKAVW